MREKDTMSKIALAGVGKMGMNHLRVLHEMPGVEVAAICDADPNNLSKAAQKHQITRTYTDLDELLEKESLDAVVLATPTARHMDQASQCLKRGLSLFVEKPLAPSEEECEAIIMQAKDAGQLLFVGHIERYNPVISRIVELLAESFLGEVYYVETVRSGPFPKRLYGSQDGVVIDLAVHDLDLVSYLFGGLRKIYAQHITIGPDGGNQDIYAKAMFETERGIVGSSEFSWISPRTERSISIYGDKGLLVGNLREQELWYYENGDAGVDYSDNYFQNVLMGRVSEGQVVKFALRKAEPLVREYEEFTGLLESGEAHDPQYGLNAVKYALAMLKSAGTEEVLLFS